jgi:hypothetical protein
MPGVLYPSQENFLTFDVATLKMEEAGSSEMLVPSYQIIWHHMLSCNRFESNVYEVTDELNSIS